jgi:sugar phosphate permease
MPRRRWRIAFLLAFGVLVNFFDRINLSVSRDALQDSFGLSLVAFGYLSSAFSWTYAVMQMPAGVLLDWLGVRRGESARFCGALPRSQLPFRPASVGSSERACFWA